MSSRITPPSADTASTSRRRWTLIIACIVLVVVIVCAIFLLANRGDDNTGSGTPPTSAPTSQPSSPPVSTKPTPSTTPTGPQNCSLRAGDQRTPTTPIHGADWSLVNKFAVPSAAGFGPQITDPDGLRRCFAHSPTGAVYAIYNFVAAMSPPGDTTGEVTFAVLRRIMTSGPNRDSYIEYLKKADDSTSNDTSVQLAGFKILDATKNRVTLLVAAGANGGFASSTWTLTWQGEDWKVVAPKPGERAGDPYTTLQDLTGFVPWQGA